MNVLQQMDHVKSYPVVRERLERKQLRVHGWWFELSTADVYFYEEGSGRFRLVGEPSEDRVVMETST